MDAPAAFLPSLSPSVTTPPYPSLRQSKALVQLDNFGFGEAFHVDDLLDFPLDDAVSCPVAEEGSSGNLSQPSLELSGSEAGTFGFCGWGSEKIGCRTAGGESVQVQEAAGQPSASELCVPPDDLADQLEWLSAFVEDNSYTADTTLAPLVSSGGLSGCKLESTTDALRAREAFQSTSPVSVLEQAGGTFSGRAWCLSPSLAVPGRARSKRSRTGGRVWSLDTLIPISVDNRLGSGDKVFINCSGESYFSSPEQEADLLSARPSKKTKRASVGSRSIDTSQPRKCGHCLVQKTPQWRAGPMGPKTLCNACGVRYKSGRLMPEYRPAGSPSFVSEVHSNSHKRILEMRRLKDFEAWEGHKPNGEDSNCIREAEDEALDVKPGAGATTIVEPALQTHEGEEDDRQSQNRSRKEDSKEDSIPPC